MGSDVVPDLFSENADKYKTDLDNLHDVNDGLYTLPAPLKEMVHVFIGGFMVKIKADGYPVITQPEVFEDNNMYCVGRVGIYGILETSKPWDGYEIWPDGSRTEYRHETTELGSSIDIRTIFLKPFYGDEIKNLPFMKSEMARVAKIAERHLREVIAGTRTYKYQGLNSLTVAVNNFRELNEAQ